MKTGNRMMLTGAVLLVVAFVTAEYIPRAAHKDFDKLVKSVGGHMRHSADYPDTYRKMSAQRRMLQNVYIGAAGLLVLWAGLSRQNKLPEPASEDENPEDTPQE